ncbi:hypothetical protein P170DRAFT_482254 [Aspergillus steynii IBT 23096]|uniref:Uncharacterized protein n=1 Tax=Aspergillus steynii IBT 23096 TaxID=1392250 RepID=A0A2I2GMD1_9EURO|nr:uncharacterized protein P170DRAFT_482254 [Aspergillus steynii IBT 23096]PLB54009.1 hypothetical protein P170DRAFT_482254 [Aspergillus steynii IBT 23096]
MSTNDAGMASFAEIMRHHGELMVNPLLWTSRHLEIMGARFQHLENASQVEQPRDDERPSEGLADREYFARVVAWSLDRREKYFPHVANIVREHSKGPEFMFAGRPVHRPVYTVFRRRDQPDRPVSQESLALIGYVNYTNVSGPRWHKCYPRPRKDGRDNSPVQKKLDRVTPEERTEDPYFICILLSLTQLQERLLESQKRENHLSRLLVAFPFDPEYIHIYEARITSDFLRALETPTTAMKEAKFPTIEHRKIPFRPYKTFQERILVELSINNFSLASDVPNGTLSNVTNPHLKRPYEQADDERCKRGRVS